MLSYRGNIPPNGYFKVRVTSPQAQGLWNWWPLLGPFMAAAGKVALPAEGSIAPVSSVAYVPRFFPGSNDQTSIRLPVAGNTDPFASAWGYSGTGLDIANKTPFSIGCWFLNQGGFNRYILNVGSVANVMKNLYIFWSSSTSIAMGFYSYDVGAAVSDMANKWCHVCLTYDPGTDAIRAYFNGRQVASRLVDPGGYTGDGAFTLGNSNPAVAGSHVWGAIADVRFYKRTLSPDVIWQWYAPGTRWQLFDQPGHSLLPYPSVAAAGRFVGGDFFMGGW